MTFSERLRTLRTAKQVSQERLARDASLSLGCVARYESGQRQPTLPSLVRLARALDCGIEQLADAAAPAEAGA